MLNHFISLFHLILVYFLFAGTLITTEVNSLLLLLILMCVIKYAFYFFDRCMLSLLENNDTFSIMSFFLVNNTPSCTLDSQCCKITEREFEEILINFGILMILNKIFILLSVKYYS